MPPLRGRVVVVGDVGLDLKRHDMYEKDLELRMSTSYGPGRLRPRVRGRGPRLPLRIRPLDRGPQPSRSISGCSRRVASHCRTCPPSAIRSRNRDRCVRGAEARGAKADARHCLGTGPEGQAAPAHGPDSRSANRDDRAHPRRPGGRRLVRRGHARSESPQAAFRLRATRSDEPDGLDRKGDRRAERSGLRHHRLRGAACRRPGRPRPHLDAARPARSARTTSAPSTGSTCWSRSRLH